MPPRIRSLLLLLLFCALPVSALAQEEDLGIIRGTVIDADNGDTIPGVQVVLPELSLGAITNADGMFRIANVTPGSYEIQARFVGFRTVSESVSVEAGETVTVDFELTPSSINLDEVVVTGTGGPVERRKLGNSIASIKASDLENAPIQSFSDLLQGREPGMVGLPSGGLTGEGARIRIRGSASLSQSNEPLIYVDGVRINNGGGFGSGDDYVDTGGGGSPSRLDDIDPESIDRVEVLKGAAAATLFGTEASNGVIQVFLKRGQAGSPRFNFTTEQTAIRYPDVYPDQVGFARTNAQARQMTSILGQEVKPLELTSANFPNTILGTGYAQQYGASVSGGGETALGGVTYFLAGRFLDENGPFTGNEDIMPTGASTLASDEMRRAQGSATLEILPRDDLRIRMSTFYTDVDFSTLQTNNNIYGTISLAQFSKPELVAPNNQTGTIAFASLAESMQQTVNQDVRHFYGSFGLNYRPQQWLTLDGIFGIDFTNAASEEFRPFGWNVDGFASDQVDGRKGFVTTNDLQLSGDFKANFQNEIGDRFESTAIVGAQGFITRVTLESGQGVDFPGPGFEVTEAAANQNLIESFSEVVNAGVFAQEQLGFDDWVFLTVGARYDANSAFGEEFDGVLYPKASLSLIPSDSPYWTGPYGPLSSVRIRAAVGQSGLQPGAFDALTTFEALPSNTGAGVAPLNLGNADLKPEVSTEYELGLELGFLEDRVALETTYWDRTVQDALVSRQFAPSGGFRRQQLVNIGELKGRGVEIAARALVLNRKNVSIDVFANTSYLWEQVTDLGGAPPIKVGGSYPRYRNYLLEGYSPGTHFGVQTVNVEAGRLPTDLTGPNGRPDGQPDTRDQLLTYLAGLDPGTTSLPSSVADPTANADDDPTNDVPGILLDSNPDSPTGVPTDFFLGKPTPDWQGSFGFDVGFLRNFTASTLFEYKFGNYYINNLTDAFRQANGSIGRNLPESARVERDYIAGGVSASGTPRNDAEVRYAALDEWVNELLALAPFSGLNTIEEADYLRWRELSLTYSVPKTFIERFGARSLSITFAGRNLALWTKYGGIDPELNAVGRGGGDGEDSQLDNNFLEGVEAFGFPIPRRYSFRVRLGF